MSSTAAQQAAELTKNVNEKVKEGSLLSSLQSSVGTVSNKLTDVSSKAWTNIGTYWGGGEQSGQTASLTSSSSSSNVFGRGGYNSVPGETGASSYQTNYDDDDYARNYGKEKNNQDDFDLFRRSNSGTNLSSKASASKPKDDWNWEENDWENASSPTLNNKAASQNKTSKSNSNNNNNNKSSKPAPKKDLINFDDDSWEPVEPFKSK